MVQQCFQSKPFGENKVNYAKITITIVCSIALTLAGSPIGLMFKQLPRALANVNA